MKTTELENSQMNVEMQTNSSSSKKLEFEILKDTPFTIVKQNDEYFGILGNHRLTDGYKDKKILIRDLKKITWNRLIQVIWGVVEKFTKININDLENFKEN